MNVQQLRFSCIMIVMTFIATLRSAWICSAVHGLSKRRSNAIMIISNQSPPRILFDGGST